MAQASDPKDRRVHARLKFLVEVVLEHEGRALQGRLRDLSLGGARVAVAHGVVTHGDTIRLQLPRARDGKDVYDAEVVRIEDGDGIDTLGLRFALFDDEHRDRLRATLSRLMQRQEAEGKRTAPRLACRLEIRYDSGDELRGILEDISRGGLAMTTTEDVEVGQEVLLNLPDSAGEELLAMRAVVIHSRESSHGPQTTRVGLRFTPMSPERDALLRALITHLGTGVAD